MATTSFKKIWIYLALIVLSFVFTFLKIAPDKPSKITNIITGKVTKIKDGDTIVISPNNGRKSFACRLYGIDTPETSKKGKHRQPYGEEAAKVLENLVLWQTVEVTTTGDKTYNREVCHIEKNGVDINMEMVRRGYAWAYREYLKRPYASDYIHAENEARSKRLGVWQQANPQPPWEFRKIKTN